MLLQRAHGIYAGGIAHTDFLGKSGKGSGAPAVVVTQGVEDVEGVLGLLTVTEGAELEREEGADFADAGKELLICSVEVPPVTSMERAVARARFTPGMMLAVMSCTCAEPLVRGGCSTRKST